MKKLRFLCRLDQLPDGGARGFAGRTEAEDSVLLVRRGDAVFGWRDACPHYGSTPLAWRKDEYLSADGSHIVCAAHGARFDVETGACTLGPCLGQSLQPVVLRLAGRELFIDAGDTKDEARNGCA